MNTKAVYVVVSGDKDVYFEQAWVSAWSLKHYNPEMRVECVVDQYTYDNIVNSCRKNALDVIDKLIKVDIPDEYDNKMRSRWLKTSLRNHVQGNYIFLDCDTIVCDNIDELDYLTGQIMMVLDSHLPLSLKADSSIIQKKVKLISNRVISSNKYYNSGVMYVKDTDNTHDFYKNWHKNWKTSLKKGMVTDQPALAVTQFENDIVEVLEDVYHCQIKNTVKYLSSAKIIHFFCLGQKADSPNPFYNSKIYWQIKQDGKLSDDLKKKILGCKSQFVSPSCIITGEEIPVKNSVSYELLVYTSMRYSHLFRFINSISWIILMVLKKIKSN